MVLDMASLLHELGDVTPTNNAAPYKSKQLYKKSLKNVL